MVSNWERNSRTSEIEESGGGSTMPIRYAFRASQWAIRSSVAVLRSVSVSKRTASGEETMAMSS